MSNREDFLTALNTFIERTEKIDKDTPWQEVEPQWWLLMMKMQRAAIATKQEMTK